MPADRLIVLRAGMPPARGTKIVYWRERAFTLRVGPSPVVPAHPGTSASGFDGAAPPTPAGLQDNATHREADMDDLTLDLVLPALARAGLEPLPPNGATDAEVEAWVERFIDASVQQPIQEINHGR